MQKLSALFAMLPAWAVPAACGTASGEIKGNTFHVGTIPNPSDGAGYLGEDQGFFADAGLDVQPKIATGFAPNLASVINGESQVGFAAVVPLIVAKSKGAPVTIIAG